MKLKVCGMKYPDNMTEVALLQPDYMGFIFYEKSARYFEGDIAAINPHIKKTGVFVNSTIEGIQEKVKTYGLQAVQLHGDEDVEFCKSLREFLKNVEIIKVFSVLEDFDFSLLKPYEPYADFFLFDTKGKLPGGNGYTFDWKVLKDYPSEKPYFLSGGIGLETMPQLQEFLQLPGSKKCYAIDVNSKFEKAPGLKNREQLKIFVEKLNSFLN